MSANNDFIGYTQTTDSVLSIGSIVPNTASDSITSTWYPTTTSLPSTLNGNYYTTVYSYPVKDDILDPENLLNETKDKSGAKKKMSPTTIIKNRAHVFRSFLSVIEKNKEQFMKDSGFAIPEIDPESKKRCRYWAGNLFSPTSIFIKKILYITTLKNGENEMKWKDLNSIQTVTPLGLDIWGTMGGFAQRDELDWGKALFSFTPSNTLLKLIQEPTYPICFTTSYAIEIPKNEPAPVQEQATIQRTIEYDLE
jgi:hypothetical protein